MGGTLYRYGERYRMVFPRVEALGGRGGERREDGDDRERFAQSLQRSRSRVLELGLCNPWDWFVTGTLDGSRWDRHDLGSFRKALSQWMRNQRRDKGDGEGYRYLFIPEPHEDGAVHFHGLLGGVPPSEVARFGSDAPSKLRRGGFRDWPAYARAFGFVSLGPLRDPQRAASYVSKYIAKSMGAAAGFESHQRDKHLFYASNGLAGREVVAEGVFCVPAYARESLFSGDWTFSAWGDRADEWLSRQVEDGFRFVPGQGIASAGTRFV